MDTPPHQLRADESRRFSDTHDDINGCARTRP
jgi:hypothetical protein